MRCSYCNELCGALPESWTGPNRMSGTDYFSDCHWEPIVDDNGNKLSTEEIHNAIREERIANDS